LAEEAESLATGTGRTYSNRRSRKKESSSHKPKSMSRVCAKA